MKRYLSYFVTMLLVLAVTDFFLGGALLRFGGQISDKNNIEVRPEEPENSEVMNMDELGEFIASKSRAFVHAAFERNKTKVEDMLSKGTRYVVSKDKSSYIRYTAEDSHVEGYMATNRKLVESRQSWYVMGDDGTITSGVEVVIEGEAEPQIWYIHYRKSSGHWKIFMLENGM